MVEILQNIWIALATENIFINNILGLPLCLIDVSVYMLLFTTILGIKANKKQKITFVLIEFTISYLFRNFVSNPYATIIIMFTLPIVVTFVLKVHWIKGILSEIIIFATSLILESLFGKLVLIFTQTPLEITLNIPIYRTITICLIYGCVFLFYLYAKNLKFSLSFLENLNRKTKKLLILNLLLALFVIISQLILLFYFSDTFSLFMNTLNVISIVIYFAISFLSFFSTAELSITTRNLEEEQLSKKTLQLLYDNISAFKHDFGNIVQGIGGYIATDDIDGLKKYYSQLLEDCQHTNNLTTLSPTIVNNHAIYNVLASKYHKADELGIKINLDVVLDLEQLHIKIYEITRMLGILMDNAIEASFECNEKIINVGFKEDCRRNMQTIIIENTFKDDNIDTDKIFTKGYSTKKNQTGLGLWQVEKILKRNNNLNLYTTKNGTFFRQQLEIFY